MQLIVLSLLAMFLGAYVTISWHHLQQLQRMASLVVAREQAVYCAEGALAYVRWRYEHDPSVCALVAQGGVVHIDSVPDLFTDTMAVDATLRIEGSAVVVRVTVTGRKSEIVYTKSISLYS